MNKQKRKGTSYFVFMKECTLKVNNRETGRAKLVALRRLMFYSALFIMKTLEKVILHDIILVRTKVASKK